MESKVDIAIKQFYKGQDEAHFFKVPTSQIDIDNGWDSISEVVVVFDGHGDNFFINQIRKIDLPSHFIKENPAESIQTAVDELQRKLNISYEIACKSGATMSFVTIKKNSTKGIYRIHCSWLGDSPIFLYKNGECFFKSRSHRSINKDEIERLRKMNILSVKHETVSLPNFDIIDKNTAKQVKTNYVCLRGNYCMEFTRSLGHKRIIGIDPETHSFDFALDDSIRIVLCTDGITDMLNTDTISEDRELLKTASASKILEYAIERWNKEWIIHILDEKTGEYKEYIDRFDNNEIDDCACITWESQK
jgi:serine/threonine protein phosphatase PrpC